jgi:hypothetical protein
MAVDLFEDAPGACAYGHYFGPGKVSLGWTPCGCQAARDEAERSGAAMGHRYIVCRVCEAGGRKTWIFLPPCSDDCDV